MGEQRQGGIDQIGKRNLVPQILRGGCVVVLGSGAIVPIKTTRRRRMTFSRAAFAGQSMALLSILMTSGRVLYTTTSTKR